MRPTLLAFVNISVAAMATLAGIVAVVEGARDPIGTYRLVTVDGSRLPVVWQQVDHPEGGLVSLSFVSGSAEVARDGTITVLVTTAITGPGTPGESMTDTVRGTWRRGPEGRLEIRFADGRRAAWPDADAYRSLTIRAMRIDLDGERRPITMVLVRECVLAISGPPRCA